MSDDDSHAIVPLPLRAASSYLPNVQERMYEIWAGMASMNAASAVRWYAREVDADTPIPTERTVARWVHELHWWDRVRDELERNHGQLLYEMELRDLMTMKMAGEEMAKILAGLYDDNPYAGALRVKVREMLGREYERKIRPRLPSSNRKSDARKWSDMSLEEQEAVVRGQIQERKQDG